MLKNKITSSEYNPYFETYLSKVEDNTSIRDGLSDISTSSNAFVSNTILTI